MRAGAAPSTTLRVVPLPALRVVPLPRACGYGIDTSDLP